MSIVEKYIKYSLYDISITTNLFRKKNKVRHYLDAYSKTNSRWKKNSNTLKKIPECAKRNIGNFFKLILE